MDLVLLGRESIMLRTDIEYFSAIIDTCPAAVFFPDLLWKAKSLVFSGMEATQKIHKIPTGTSHLLQANPLVWARDRRGSSYQQSAIRDQKESRKRSSRNYWRRGENDIAEQRTQA
jgi:hypothetical protein